MSRRQPPVARVAVALLRVEFQGGHGIGSTRRQVDEELAGKLAFLLDQLGM